MIMSDSDHPEPPDSEEDKTLLLPNATPSALLRDNAGRIFAQMLGDGARVESEGDSIGPYRLCEMLGEGGFGNVWRAEQTEVVKREVAVKVIKLGMDTAQVLGALRPGAAGAGESGSSEHRHHAGCGRGSEWATVFRHGTGARGHHHELVRIEQRHAV